jgi:hypothetical protein
MEMPEGEWGEGDDLTDLTSEWDRFVLILGRCCIVLKISDPPISRRRQLRFFSTPSANASV